MYYPDLSEFIRRHHIEKKIKSHLYPGSDLKPGAFDGVLPVADQPILHPYLVKLNIGPDMGPRIKHNQFVRNKWHVCLMLVKNRDLVKYRKRNWVKKPTKPSQGIVAKIKKCLCATPCAKCLLKNQAQAAKAPVPVTQTSRATSVRPDSSKSNQSYLSSQPSLNQEDSMVKSSTNSINLRKVLIKPEDERSLKQLKIQEIDEFNSRTFF